MSRAILEPVMNFCEVMVNFLSKIHECTAGPEDHLGDTNCALQRGRIQKGKIQKGILTPEDGTDSCPDTSVINYQYSPRNNPEESSSHLLRGGSLISHFGDVIFKTLKAYIRRNFTVDAPLYCICVSFIEPNS